jgi:hypothetical protein
MKKFTVKQKEKISSYLFECIEELNNENRIGRMHLKNENTKNDIVKAIENMAERMWDNY